MAKMVFFRRWFFPFVLLFIVVVAGRVMAVQSDPAGQVGLRTVVEPTQEETAVSPTQPSLVPGEPMEQMGEVIAQGLNVRLGAGSEFGVITAVKQGTELELLGQDLTGRWLKVVLPTGEKGWVSATFVARPDTALKLPVVVSEAVRVTATPILIVIATAKPEQAATATGEPTKTLRPTSTAMVAPTHTATATPTPIPTDTATVAPTHTATATPTPIPTDTAQATHAPTQTALPTHTVTAVSTATAVAETAPPTATPVAIAQLADPTIPAATLSEFTPPSDGFSIIKVVGTVFLVIAFLFTLVIFVRLNQRRV